MAFLKYMMVLTASALAVAQTPYYGHTTLEPVQPTLDYQQIAKILQAPIFRKNPSIAASDQISSYLPTTYAVTELNQGDEAKTSTGGFLSPVPSVILQAPRADATDSYNAYKAFSAPAQNYQAYAQANPQSIRVQSTPKYIINEQASLNKYLPINPLSKQLDLPLPDDKSTYTYPPVPSTELQTPLFEPYNNQFNPGAVLRHHIELQSSPQNQNPFKVLATNLDNPNLSQTSESLKPEPVKPSKVPTVLFPKKYNSNVDEHKPKKSGKTSGETLGEKNLDLMKNAKYVKAQKSAAMSQENKDKHEKNLQKMHEKQRQKFEESQKKSQSRKENESRQQQQLIDATIARASVTNVNEQEASESGFHETGASFNAAPPHPSLGLGSDDVSHGEDAQRTEFRMHGQHGPNSYKFGYDTGKGKSRQFRYEERDNDGYVKGHYGFYDKHGRLQVVNYDAHPHHGFHAEGSFHDA